MSIKFYWNKTKSEKISIEEAIAKELIPDDFEKYITSENVLIGDTVYPMYEPHEIITEENCTLAIGHDSVMMILPSGKAIIFDTK